MGFEVPDMSLNIWKSKLPKSCENKFGEGLIDGKGAKCPVESGPTFQLNSGNRFVAELTDFWE